MKKQGAALITATVGRQSDWRALGDYVKAATPSIKNK